MLPASHGTPSMLLYFVCGATNGRTTGVVKSALTWVGHVYEALFLFSSSSSVAGNSVFEHAFFVPSSEVQVDAARCADHKWCQCSQNGVIVCVGPSIFSHKMRDVGQHGSFK